MCRTISTSGFCRPLSVCLCRAMHPHSNLFVKNIPTEINEAVLRSLFQTYGTVLSCRILKSRYRGSNNVGFVKFARLEDAQLAIQYMHLATVENVVIEVRFADQDVGERRSSGGNEHTEALFLDAAAYAHSLDEGQSIEGAPCRELYVKGFPRQWRERHLTEFFSNFGTVLHAKVFPEMNSRGGTGSVMMASEEDASIALRNVDGRIPLGGDVPLMLRFANGEASPRWGKVKKQQPVHESRYAPYPNERPKKKSHSMKNSLPLAPVLTQAAIQSSNLCPVIGQKFKLRKEGAKIIKQEPYDPIPNGDLYVSDSTPYDSPYPLPAHLHLHRSDVSAVVPKREEPEKTSLYIRNLPHDVDELRLYELFGHYGGIRSVKRLPDRETKGRGGVGFVNYVDYTAASLAVSEMDGLRIGNHVLTISLQVRPVYNR